MREIREQPTKDKDGLLIKHYRCSYCNHREARAVVIAKCRATSNLNSIFEQTGLISQSRFCFAVNQREHEVVEPNITLNQPPMTAL